MATFDSALVIGLLLGAIYAVLALAFVLVFKATRVLNLSQGQIGATGALLFVWMIAKHHVNYGVAFLSAMALGAAVGVVIETQVIRRLRNTPPLVVAVATLGLSQLLFAGGQIAVPPDEQSSFNLIGGFPQPFEFHHQIFGVALNGGEVLVMVVVPIITLALAIFLRFTRFGVGMRAAADNADNARLLSVSPRLVAVTAWGLAGALAALAAIFDLSTTGSTGQLYVGVPLLLYSLAPALLAGLTRIPRAALAGVGIGLLESFILAYTHEIKYVDLAVFLAVVLGLLLQAQGTGRARELGGLAFPTPAGVRRIRDALDPRRQAALRRGAVAGVAAFLVLLAFQVPSATAHILSLGIAFAIVGLSASLLTGLSGQVSLGQWAIAGAGAYAAAQAGTRWNLNIFAVVGFAMLVGTLVSLAIGVPALRLRGLLLSVTTLAFAVAASSFFFTMSWAAGLTGIPEGLTRPDIARTSLQSDNAYYLFSLGCLGLALLIGRSLRGGRLGRNLAAVRENERTAAAFGINVAVTKLTGFAVNGALAGLGGAVYVLALQNVSPTLFPADRSFLVVSIAVIGGIGTLSGPLIGALLLVVVPALLPGNDNAALVGSGIGVLAVLLLLPEGISGLLARIGRWVVAPPSTSVAAPATDVTPAAVGVATTT